MIEPSEAKIVHKTGINVIAAELFHATRMSYQSLKILFFMQPYLQVS